VGDAVAHFAAAGHAVDAAQVGAADDGVPSSLVSTQGCMAPAA
jgi:hypothetical protein